MVLFGDPLTVFPPALHALQVYNDSTVEEGKPFTQPVQYTFTKWNKNHKGVGAVASTTEQALVFYYKFAPRIGQNKIEITTSLHGSRTVPTQLFKDPSSQEPFNSTQKPPAFLHPFLVNHLNSGDFVLDLTAGSCVSLFAAYATYLSLVTDQCPEPVLTWVGCDPQEKSLAAYRYLVQEVSTNGNSMDKKLDCMHILFKF